MPETQPPLFLSLAGTIARRVQDAIAVAVAVLPLAYVCGHFYLQAYCRAFGAEWLPATLDARVILSYGLVPALLIALYFFMMARSLEGPRGDPVLFTRFRPRVLTFFLALLVLLGITAMMYGSLVPPFIAWLLGWAGIVLLGIAALWMLWLLFVDFRRGRLRGRYSDWLQLVLLTMLTVWLFPWLKGWAEGSIQSAAKYSRLPQVEFHQDAPCDDPRLLFMTSSDAIVTCLATGGESASIVIIGRRDLAATRAVR